MQIAIDAVNIIALFDKASLHMGSIVQFGTAGLLAEHMKDIQQEQLDILKDMVKRNVTVATERIQLMENATPQL